MLKKYLLGILITLVALCIIGVCTGTYLWYKPHEKVEDVKGITITATELCKEYNSNEKQADSLYLNKAIKVSGTINEIDTNQDGGIMLVLAAENSSSGVECAMREKNIIAKKGQQVVTKGFCSGNGITGVSLTDCVLENKK